MRILGQGFYWPDLERGRRFKTYRRTITESDLINFINGIGMLEAISINADTAQTPVASREGLCRPR